MMGAKQLGNSRKYYEWKIIIIQWTTSFGTGTVGGEPVSFGTGNKM